MKISIIIPNYNNAEYIIRCLNSVSMQSMEDIEIIVIDDGSTDDSVTRIKQFMENSNHKVKFIEQFNQNASIARNRGIEVAEGDYLYFIDSDDELFDETILEKIYNDIDGYDLLIGNYVRINEMGQNVALYKINEDRLIDVDSNYKYSLISPVPSNKLYKKSVIKDNNLYFSNVRIGQDLNFYLKYLAVCKNIKIVDYDIYKYRILQNSISRSINLNILDIYTCFLEIEKYYKINNKLEDFYKYISIAKLIHYNIQMEKIIRMSSGKDKKFVYNFFMYHLRNVDYSKIFKEKNYNELKHKIIMKRLFKVIYLSTWYPKLKRIIKDRNKTHE